MTSPGFYICFQRSKKRCLKFGNIFLLTALSYHLTPGLFLPLFAPVPPCLISEFFTQILLVVSNDIKEKLSLLARPPVWASKTGLARTRERAAKPRGAEERRACNHPLQIFICTSPRRREISLAEKWRSGNQSWLITGQAGTRFVCVSNLVLRGIRLVRRTCFSPQCRRAR